MKPSALIGICSGEAGKHSIVVKGMCAESKGTYEIYDLKLVIWGLCVK